jgi:hypothetical protein
LGWLSRHQRFSLWQFFNVEWGRCKRQSVFALSNAEAEFRVIAASLVVQEIIFFGKFLDNLGFKQNSPTPTFADYETCIHWSEGSVGSSDHAKRIDPAIILYLTPARHFSAPENRF